MALIRRGALRPLEKSRLPHLSNEKQEFLNPWYDPGNRYSIPYATTVTLIGYNASWHIGQRYYSVPTEKDARKMAILCAVLSLILPLLWIAPTMAARLLFPNIASIWPQLAEPSEASFVTLALTLLPNGLIGLTLSAILAATMTTNDTSLNYLASILVRDVYIRAKRALGHPAPDAGRQLKIARITTFTLGVLAIGTAIILQRSHGVFDFALMYYSWFGPSMATPVMLGLVYTKTPSWSCIAASTVSLIGVLLGNTVINMNPYQYEFNIFGGILLAAAVFFLSSLWQDKEPAVLERIRSFALDLKTPAVAQSLVWDRNALYSYKVVGVLTMAIGAALLLMMLVPAAVEVRLLTLLTGLTHVALGGGMLWYFGRQLKLIRSGVQAPPVVNSPSSID